MFSQGEGHWWNNEGVRDLELLDVLQVRGEIKLGHDNSFCTLKSY